MFPFQPSPVVLACLAVGIAGVVYLSMTMGHRAVNLPPGPPTLPVSSAFRLSPSLATGIITRPDHRQLAPNS